MSVLSASNSLLRTTMAQLEDQAASLKADLAHCRANFSALQVLESQLSANSTGCVSRLQSAATQILGFEAGIIVLALWLACEHVGRPLWAKYREDPFPIDR